MNDHSGLIPARAGNTHVTFIPNDTAWAHPRSRGEHILQRHTMPPSRGSSPLARGTLMDVFGKALSPGLIPARAGNTKWVLQTVVNDGAHPRSRGEHMTDLTLKLTEAGSSPLARGTLCTPGFSPYSLGLIPARAGNTFQVVTSAPLPWAHPRSRGEHSVIGVVIMPALGSSPLARGTQADSLGIGHLYGLIPARAGNTASLLVRLPF